MNLFQITDIKMILTVALSVLWIVSGMLLYAFIGVKHGPDGGLDKLADAVVYVFIWRLFIYGPPVLITVLFFALWLIQNHIKAVPIAVIIIIALILGRILYIKFFRKIIYTPEKVAAGISSFEKWRSHNDEKSSVEYTEHDIICRYSQYVISETMNEYRSMQSEDDVGLKTAFIDAALKAHCQELSQVEGWEYFPDIKKLLIPPRRDGDERFLLSNSDFRHIAGHYHRTMNRDHWYDRYQFKNSPIAEWFSWLPMLAIFYNDGTMDMVIAT